MAEESRASALRVQRDAAHRELTRLDTHNRMLRKHQADIRNWLAEAIDQFDAARDTDEVLAVADRIRVRAGELKAEAERLAP